MENHFKMADKHRILVLFELSWSYRRIQRETSVRREAIAWVISVLFKDST
ncbi:hypothetical protein ACFLVX_05205 [Chloroflexota bacterium]